MSIHTLKSIVRRGSTLGAVFAIVAATFAPASLTFADALNPLTNRSLTLSSSSPGWSYTDGSGNATYAPPNSGANGQKTGNTFAFNVSSDSSSSNTIKGISFQYCIHSAGTCMAPGNDTYTGTAGSYTARNGDSVSAQQSDLNVATSTPTELSPANFTAMINAAQGVPTSIPNRDDSQGNFVVLQKDSGATNWTQSTGWAMTATPNEDGGTVALGTATGKNNYITLKNSAGGLALHPTGAVKIIFFGTNGNYITNPGAGEFFVKINDYNSATTLNNTTLVDGGVTVANVMNQSIEIQTKVLETMDFSVGTVDPYTLSEAQFANTTLGHSQAKHGQCDQIQNGMNMGDPVNVLQLGDQTNENSLSTTKTYSTHSYWRLSSNSSAGATVYYSGVTLKNTVGNQIAPMTTKGAPLRGTEQFGLALANSGVDASTNELVNYSTEETANQVFENGADKTATQGVDPSVSTDTATLTGYHSPRLYPLTPASNYDSGAGVVNAPEYGASTTAQFAFDPNSNLIPTPLASESAQVVDCVTGKVRYIANIAATTPAGIYTTKINYIAAPQY